MDRLKNKVKLKIKDFITKNDLIRTGDSVLLGLSGGPDSVLLLIMLSELKDILGFRLYALHVNHEIRGEEAIRDQEFSRDIARSLNVPFEAVSVDVPSFSKENGLSLEEGARIERYRLLEEKRLAIEKKERRCLIAVAHHMDDQAETVIHNLLRGSGLKGIAAMEASRDNLIRPLLCIRRRDIMAVLQEMNIPHVYDSSNMDTDYTRNFIRADIIPSLEKVNKKAVRHIFETSSILLEADTYIKDEAVSFIEKNLTRENANTVSISTIELKKEKPILRKYIYIEMIDSLDVKLKDWGLVHFNDIDSLIYKGGGSHLDLPYKVSADINKKTLILKRNREVISMKRRKNK